MKRLSSEQRNEEIDKFAVVFLPEKYRVISSAIYRARLMDVSEGIGCAQQDVFILLFQLLESKFKGCRLNGIVNSDSNGVNGKIWELVWALTGMKKEISSSVNLQELVDRECYINIEQNGGKNAIREYIHLDEFRDLEGSSREE